MHKKCITMLIPLSPLELSCHLVLHRRVNCWRVSATRAARGSPGDATHFTGLRLTTEFEDGGPIHAWFFLLWWIASVWGEGRSRGWSQITHRSRMISFSCLCIFHHSINPDRLFFIASKCEDVGLPLSHCGRCPSGRVNLIHRARYHLRSFLVFLHALLVPVIDNPEPNLSLRTIFDTPSVFIACYGPHRMDHDGSTLNSVVDTCLIPPTLTSICSRYFTLESTDHH